MDTIPTFLYSYIKFFQSDWWKTVVSSSPQKQSATGVRTLKTRPTGRRCLSPLKQCLTYRGRRQEKCFYPRSGWLKAFVCLTDLRTESYGGTVWFLISFCDPVTPERLWTQKIEASCSMLQKPLPEKHHFNMYACTLQHANNRNKTIELRMNVFYLVVNNPTAANRAADW